MDPQGMATREALRGNISQKVEKDPHDKYTKSRLGHDVFLARIHS